MELFEIAHALEELELVILPGLISGIPSFAFSAAAYVLTAIALYTMATRRGLSNAWLSWIPVLNLWIIGSLSDQYRYVVKGQVKSKRKVLLVLEVLKAVLGVCVIAICVYMVIVLMSGMMGDVPAEMVGPVVAVAGLGTLLVIVAIASMVIRYMALYDIYVSCDPSNSVLFLVLSILVGVTEPFFLFFNRNKDLGMPPRRQEYTQEPQEPVYEAPVQEFWETGNTDYL